MGSTERGLGILIESFADFLQRLIEGNGNMEPSEKELEKALIAQGNLTLKETLKLPFSNWSIKLKNINTKELDRLAVHLYGKMMNDKTNSVERLERTIIQLISYLDGERNEFSLERNNIKNSLLHSK
ncbi:MULTISPECIES: hypothetical protein [Flavobacteriaceae]|uniref:hypothetical protein n=1 Tax=Flavobacteriaceae TaxID=49546 RepID=UPI00234C014E|nr:hypothetical protein [Muricauda sp. SP22]MDC6363644.1 hypothetical protein [Muricauda sp. SP22]